MKTQSFEYHSIPRRLTHLNDLGVLASQELAEGRNEPLLDQVGHLLLSAGDGQVRNGPGGFFLRLELASRQQMDDLRNQTRVDHRLYLQMEWGFYTLKLIRLCAD